MDRTTAIALIISYLVTSLILFFYCLKMDKSKGYLSLKDVLWAFTFSCIPGFNFCLTFVLIMGLLKDLSARLLKGFSIKSEEIILWKKTND